MNDNEKLISTSLGASNRRARSTLVGAIAHCKVLQPPRSD